MNFAIYRNFQGGITSFVKELVTLKTLQVGDSRGNHHFEKLTATIINTISMSKHINFLTPKLPQFNQVHGMKQKGFLKLQCKSCHSVTRCGRLFVVCKEKPSHKQVQPIKKFKYTRILTFASQKKIRDW